MLQEMIDILTGFANDTGLKFDCYCDLDDKNDLNIYTIRFEDPVSHCCLKRCFSQQMLDVFKGHGKWFAQCIIKQTKLAFCNDC